MSQIVLRRETSISGRHLSYIRTGYDTLKVFTQVGKMESTFNLNKSIVFHLRLFYFDITDILEGYLTHYSSTANMIQANQFCFYVLAFNKQMQCRILVLYNKHTPEIDASI